MGFSAVAIADRVGHESIDITYQYAHLFPSKQIEMAEKLDDLSNKLSKITLLTFEELVFPGIEQEVVVFIGEKGDSEKGIKIVELNNLEDLENLNIYENGFQKLNHVHEKWTKYFKVIVGSGTNSAKVICGSANITTGGLANNIEAGIISKLNLRCESDEKFLTEVREYIDNIIHNYPQNVKKISEDRELDELYEQGLVVDENQRKLRNNFFCASKEKQEKSIVSRFPLVNKKLLNFGKKQKQTNAILRKLDQVIVEEVCEEVWKSNKLTKSHLGIVKKGTHAKGEMSLGKGQYRQIDQFTYFRDTVFRDLDWKNNKSGDEIANAYFTMIICGINYGEYKLRILHKRKGMVAYQQNNYVTNVCWI